MTSEDRQYAIQRLYDWGANESPLGLTFDVFLQLTGLDGGPDAIGYLEADLLGRALLAWAEAPQDVQEYTEEAIAS